MRIGFNPYKDLVIEETQYNHQIVIPVYIPNQDGYYKESFKILRLCMESVFKTTHSKTFITVVNNGSSPEIAAYLDELFALKKIHEIIHTDNIGKLNAILKGLAGNQIELVTISDSDVLFLEGWQKETLAVFNNFPKAGVVGIVPQMRGFGSFCGNLVVENFFSKKLKFSAVKNPEALQNFYASLGWKDDYNKDYLKLTLTIENNSHTAVVGSGHFVATYRKEIFSEMVSYIGYKLGGDSETYLDKLPLKYGLWRLTTNDNHAYHMGNTYEEWMGEKLDSFKNTAVDFVPLTNKRKVQPENRFSFYIKNVLFMKFFKKRKYKRLFYKFKRMPKQMIAKY